MQGVSRRDILARSADSGLIAIPSAAQPQSDEGDFHLLPLAKGTNIHTLRTSSQATGHCWPRPTSIPRVLASRHSRWHRERVRTVGEFPTDRREVREHDQIGGYKPGHLDRHRTDLQPRSSRGRRRCSGTQHGRQAVRPSTRPRPGIPRATGTPLTASGSVWSPRSGRRNVSGASGTARNRDASEKFRAAGIETHSFVRIRPAGDQKGALVSRAVRARDPQNVTGCYPTRVRS